jgi:hypothetical protein
MAASIPGIEIESLTPKRMFIKRKNSKNLKVKLLSIDKNTDTIRIQGEKDRDARDYFSRDISALEVTENPTSKTLSMKLRSGIEIALFEAVSKDYSLLNSFRDELIGYLGDVLPAVPA